MKKCKKCGRLPDLWKIDGQKMIGCLGCGIKIPFQGDVKEAIEKWDEMQEGKENEKMRGMREDAETVER